MMSPQRLYPRLLLEKSMHISGGIFNRVQIDLAYNSNRIEGSMLTHEQTRYIFETNTIGIGDSAVNVDDIIETVNHFRCFDFIIDNALSSLNQKSIKLLHKILKSGTSISKKDWFSVGDYKKIPNEVGGRMTTAPEKVRQEMATLIKRYGRSANKSLEDILAFHVAFERIHPFQDGNGRVGRLIMFKECLRCGITPFIVGDDLKLYYYRGLSEWDDMPGYLIDTCLTAQDRFKKILDYFKVAC